MKKRNWVVKSAAVALPVICLIAVSNVEARPPRSASSSVAHTGPAGNTATRQSTASTTGQGGYSASSTVTGPAGKTATRQQSGAYDPTTKTFARSATTTGPNGKSATTQGQASYDASTGTLNQSRTKTGPNGKTSTENRTVQTGTAPAQP